MPELVPDTGCVRAFLRQRCASDLVDRLELTYMKMKPGRGGEFLYEARGGQEGDLRVSARQVARGAGQPLVPSAEAATAPLLYAEDLQLVFQVFPTDRSLPSLVTLTDACAMASVLGTALARDGEPAALTSVAIDVVRYKPERKCVLRYDLEWAGSDSLPWLVYAKAVRSDVGRAAGLLATLRESPAVGGFDLPEPLGVLPELAAELYSHVPGAALSTFCEADDFPPMCRGVGRSLRKLQTAQVTAPPRRGADAHIAQLERTAAELALLLPSAQAQIERLRHDLSVRLAEAASGPLSIVHGDFHGDNVLVHAGGLGLVDLEDCAWDVPEKDVGSMWAQLLWLSLKGPRRPQPLEQGRRAFLDGYFEGAGGGDRETAAVQAAFHCFLFACQQLRHRSPASDESQALALLAAGQNVLQRGIL